MMRLAVVVLAVCLLAGCEQTRFESLPGEQIESCDPRWVGNWRFVSFEDDDEDDVVHVSINADCTEVRTIEEGKQEDLGATLRFARVGNLAIIATMLDEDSPKADGDEAKRPPGYHYFRYQVRRDRITLYDVDHRRVAHWLIDGKLRGSTEFTSGQPGGRRLRHGETLDNFITGDAQAMASAARLHSLFKRRPYIALIRVDTIPTSAPSNPAESSP